MLRRLTLTLFSLIPVIAISFAAKTALQVERLNQSSLSDTTLLASPRMSR